VDSEVWPWLSFVLAVVAVASVLLFLFEREKRKPLDEEAEKPVRSEAPTGLPFAMRKTITADVFEEARNKLRILELEREILSYAIRRLYEATAEGKITEEERDRLVLKYREDLARIKEEIARGESIVALNELERMQDEFVKLFSERLEELNKRIGELRTLSGFVPPRAEELAPIEPVEPAELREEGKEEEQVEAPKEAIEKEAPPKPEKKVSKPKPTAEPEKTEAEKKIEQIVAEVEKVLKKLGQMEVEE